MQIQAFTSDTHYGHRNIIEYCNRPFSSIYEMEQEMVIRYNTVVSSDMTTLWAGDCFFCSPEEGKRILSSLNGRKVLVAGNHDKSAGTMAAMGFDIVTNECVLSIAGKTVRVSHYPYEDKRYPDRCPKKNKGELLIHGHTHSPNKIKDKMIHVGVDAWSYAPATLAEIEQVVYNIQV